MLEKLCVRQKLKCINFHAQVREFRPNEVFFSHFVRLFGFSYCFSNGFLQILFFFFAFAFA